MKLLAITLLLITAKAHAVDCSNVDQVAKEGVAVSLLGADENFTTPKCFAKQKFRFFHPEKAVKEGDAPDLSKVIWLDPRKDGFSVLTVKKEGDRYAIAVKFDLEKRSFVSKYYYQPVEYFQKTAGTCGVMTHPEHNVYRADCRAK